jgi:hypothetical protein
VNGYTFECLPGARNIDGTNQHPGNLEQGRAWNPPLQVYTAWHSINQGSITLSFWKIFLYFLVSPWIVFRLRFKDALGALKAQNILSPGHALGLKTSF